MKVWITGASSGLGRYTLEALAAAGHTVVAGARSFTGAADGNVHRIPLDVTDEGSIRSFVAAAKDITGTADVLIHCAGVLVLGSCEETSAEEYRRVMETNFLGMVRVNQHVLPLMRENGGGKIVLFSSINGLLGVPFQSAYTASKHAMEGYAECLAMEARRHGIQVCLIEPGDHRGGSDAYRAHAAAMTESSPYAADFRSATAAISRDEHGGSDPARLGRKVAKLIARRRLPFRRRIASADQHLAVYLHRLTPAALHFFVLRRYYLSRMG